MSPQPQASQQEENRLIAQVLRGVASACGQDLFNLLGGQALRESGVCPVAQLRHGGLQTRADRTTKHQETQEGPDRSRENLETPAGSGCCLLLDKCGDLRRVQGTPIHLLSVTTGVEKALGNRQRVFTCGNSGTTDIVKVLSITFEPVVKGCGRRHWHR